VHRLNDLAAVPDLEALSATGLQEAEKKFRKVKGYRELAALHRRLNPQCSSKSCQEQVA
jgi:hypothetical protein